MRPKKYYNKNKYKKKRKTGYVKKAYTNIIGKKNEITKHKIKLEMKIILRKKRKEDKSKTYTIHTKSVNSNIKNNLLVVK